MALVNHKIKKREYKYFPKSKKELMEYIQTELDKGNTNLNCIDTSKNRDMAHLFDQSELGIKLTKEQQENLDISEWDVSGVVDMYAIFYECEYFNCDISSWDISNVLDMGYSFNSCKKFNQDLSHWKFDDVCNFLYTFSDCGLEEKNKPKI